MLTTVQLSGAGICWLAALGTAGERGWRLASLFVLLTMAASPIISIGADRPVLLGLALAVLTAAFLFGERLAGRPGFGAIALGAAVLAVAVPLGAAADREEPWFDYKAFSEKLSGGVPVSYDWDHDYGPIDWPREGVELFRVESDRPQYWKAERPRPLRRRPLVGRGGRGRPTASWRRRGGPTGSPTSGSRCAACARTRSSGRAAFSPLSTPPGPSSPSYLPGVWSRPGNRGARRRGTPTAFAAMSRGRRPTSSPPPPSGRPTTRCLQLRVGIRPDAIERTPSIVRRAAGSGDPPGQRRRSSSRRSRRARRPLRLRALRADGHGAGGPCGCRTTRAPGGSRPAPARPVQLALRLPAARQRPPARRGLRVHGGAAAAGPRRPGAGVLPARHPARLLPAVLGRDGDAAAHGRRSRARRDRLLARRPARLQRRVGRARHGRPLVGGGVVRRHRLDDLRPDAARDAGALPDRGGRPGRRPAAGTPVATTARAPPRCATARRTARSATRRRPRAAPAPAPTTARRGRGWASARCWRR